MYNLAYIELLNCCFQKSPQVENMKWGFNGGVIMLKNCTEKGF